MELTSYVQSDLMTLDQYLQLSEDEAVQFDFLTQGTEPDRCDLINEIYHHLFPWFDSKKHAGDTLNTYRIAVKHYYGNYYRFLDRHTQLQIVKIIEANTPHQKGQIFEFKAVDGKGQSYYQLCNNYQLGNFGILPIRDGVNPKRAKYEPYLDYFDQLLFVLDELFESKIKPTDPLKKALIDQKDYFLQFGSLSDFFTKNILWDFLTSVEEDDDSFYSQKDLSGQESFEDYVKMVTQIVHNRGLVMWSILNGGQYLTEPYEDENQSLQAGRDKSGNIEQELDEISTAFASDYKVDRRTSDKVAQLSVFHRYLVGVGNINNEYIDKVNKLTDKYDQKFEVLSKKTITKRFDWIQWWYWVVFFFASAIIFAFVGDHIQRTYWATPKLMGYQRIFDAVHTIIRLLFWGGLLSKIVYDIKFHRKSEDFESQKEEDLKKLKDQYEQNEKELTNKYADKLSQYEEEHADYKSVGSFLPEKYQNPNDVMVLYNNFIEGRATTLPGSYEVLENIRHREQVVAEQRRRADAAEETERARQRAIEQEEYRRDQVAQATADSAARQAEAAESAAREAERHNREVESRWNK